MCVCVCVCVCAHAYVCVYACMTGQDRCVCACCWPMGIAPHMTLNHTSDDRCGGKALHKRAWLKFFHMHKHTGRHIHVCMYAYTNSHTHTHTHTNTYTYLPWSLSPTCCTFLICVLLHVLILFSKNFKRYAKVGSTCFCSALINFMWRCWQTCVH